MKKRHASTFMKMTIAFVIFGLVPLLLLSFLFFYRFNGILRDTVTASYSTMTGYVTHSVEDIIDSVDEALEELYTYHDTQGNPLSFVLQNSSVSKTEKEQDVQDALRGILFKSEYISSVRMADFNGNLYSMYSSQDKVLRNDAAFHTSMDIYQEGENLTALKLFGTLPETEICINSNDYIFSMARNYMDTSTVQSTFQKALAIVYVDINVKDIENIVKKADLNQGRYYVFNTAGTRYLYSQADEDYLNGAHPLEFCQSVLQGKSGYEKVGSQWVFFEKVADTDAYGVLVMEHKQLVGNMMQSRVMLILILCFACGFLFILYMVFSIRMSEPTRQLKEAMEKVQNGNLDVRVNLHTRDEMEYVADGFNRMVEELRDYINQVYVAQICQKDAELNALKMQIKPHYLYNTLDVIRMTALDQDDMETARLLESLAHQLRYVMGDQSDRISLREELNSIREYFVIMKARYEGRITLMISINDKDCDLVVLKMLLQPLVENAIRHGLRDKEGNGAVAVTVERKETYLQIVVMDDGVGIPEDKLEQMCQRLEESGVDKLEPEDRLSIGMKNVYDRIKLNCGPEYGYTIQSTLGIGTIVTLKLPIWEEE